MAKLSNIMEIASWLVDVSMLLSTCLLKGFSRRRRRKELRDPRWDKLNEMSRRNDATTQQQKGMAFFHHFISFLSHFIPGRPSPFLMSLSHSYLPCLSNILSALRIEERERRISSSYLFPVMSCSLSFPLLCPNFNDWLSDPRMLLKGMLYSWKRE